MAKRKWNPQSQVNMRHLAHMLRGGQASYFQALAEAFASAATDGTSKAVDMLRSYLPDDVDEFMNGSNAAAMKQAARADGESQAKREIVLRLLQQGQSPDAISDLISIDIEFVNEIAGRLKGVKRGK